jgi:hypothetical protein
LAWILRGHRHDLKPSVVGGFRLGGWDVADGLEQTPVVEPIDPFKRGELYRLERAPRTTSVDHLGLEQADDGFRQGIVVLVSDTADRWLNPRLGEALGVSNRHVLNSPVAVVDEVGSPRLPVMESLLQRVEDEVGPG